ncbi:MAG: hypothetical protein WED05_12725 [Candidatus Atabeyarchaeum deiterrae]
MNENEHANRSANNNQRTGVRKSVEVSIVAMLSATAISIGILRFWAPNIELTSLIAFLSGFVFGSRIGGLVGLVTMSVSSILNPLGSGAVWPAILLTQVSCMTLIGAVGGLVSRFSGRGDTALSLSLKMGAAGFYLTLIYDLVTNFGYALSFPLAPDLVTRYEIALIAGLYFMVIHVMSNILLFGVVGPVASRSITRVIQREEAYK